MISIVIATYGDKNHWDKVAETAIRSVWQQTSTNWEMFRTHEATLAEARNYGARAASNDRLVFLDADDELDPRFVESITEAEDILQPLTVYRNLEATSEPYWIEPRTDLLDGNHIVVGAPVKRQVFLDSGGFDDYPIAEDWALWLKLRKRGATFGRTSAKYIVNVNPQGRNTLPENGWLDRIRKAYG